MEKTFSRMKKAVPKVRPPSLFDLFSKKKLTKQITLCKISDFSLRETLSKMFDYKKLFYFVVVKPGIETL